MITPHLILMGETVLRRFFALIKRIVYYYNEKQIPIASAALCYYMMMSVFPLIICLYTLLGSKYDDAMRILAFVESFIRNETSESIHGFLAYVERNHSSAMFYAGITVLLTSASAAIRSMEVTIGRMQGGDRYPGFGRIVFSLVFAVVFLLATWFAIFVMFTSRDLIELVNAYIPFVDIRGSWLWIKYLMLAGILFLFQWGIYRFCRKKRARYPTWPGAILATVGTVVMSLIFSAFIAASARYSLVYGSLASVILLMLWLYFSCQVIYIGAAFNLAIRDVRRMEYSTV
ncbi:MAG: YihY/virulence factor BrkB family protein [Oscillospiraceae bacterium]|nr:YihY/virulence factor BrkB family protein [Oscillospiraceae bacterium]